MFCNEVLCHPEKEHLPDVFFRFARWGSFNTLRCMDCDRVDDVVAANAFARLRRAWPTAVYADRVAVFESELPWLLATADDSYILSAQMLLSQHADDPQTEDPEALLDWEELVCRGEGHLVLSTTPPVRAVQETTCKVSHKGFTCPPLGEFLLQRRFAGCDVPLAAGGTRHIPGTALLVGAHVAAGGHMLLGRA